MVLRLEGSTGARAPRAPWFVSSDSGGPHAARPASPPHGIRFSRGTVRPSGILGRTMDASSPRELRLDDLEWLRRLAARLVRDPHSADDAVQDTLLTVLEQGPRARPALRAWLSVVLR